MQVITAVYLSGLLYFFCLFLTVFKQDRSLSQEEKRQSWIVLIVATIFWPIVVPLSCLEKGSIKHLFFNAYALKKTDSEVLDLKYQEYIQERASRPPKAASAAKVIRS